MNQLQARRYGSRLCRRKVLPLAFPQRIKLLL